VTAPTHPAIPGGPTDREQGTNLKVSVQSIIDQIHNRYAKQIGGLVQENSELAAAQDMLLAENYELRAKLEALMGAPSGTPTDPGGSGPDRPAARQ
jgi:hypothetical protein